MDLGDQGGLKAAEKIAKFEKKFHGGDGVVEGTMFFFVSEF